MRCKDYFKSTNFTFVTISTILTLNQLTMSTDSNLYLSSILSSNPILVPMGSVPVIKYIVSNTNSRTIRFNSTIDPSPDYTFISNPLIASNMQLANFTKLNFFSPTSNLTYWNMFVKFGYFTNDTLALTSFNKT